MSKLDEQPDLHILRTGSCKSTSAKSTLSYQIGCTSDSSIYIRIIKNSGAGFFNDEWIAVKDIEEALADGPEGQPLTSFMLQPLIEGRSSNTPAFLMAALSKERLLRVMKGKKRGHEFLDPEGFDARMQKLVSTKTETGGTAKKAPVRKAPRKKAAVKKPSVPRKKTAKTT